MTNSMTRRILLFGDALDIPQLIKAISLDEYLPIPKVTALKYGAGEANA